jgi:hypothetical protein
MAGKGECSKRSKSETLSELPMEIWKYIIQLVATISLQSTMELRCVSKFFKELVDDSSTFAVIDMDGFGGGYRHTGSAEADRQVQVFTIRCWEAKNPESLFRMGVQVLALAANLALALEYFDMACKPRILSGPCRSLVKGHHVAFYTACMMRILQGTRDEQLQIVQQLCSVLDWRKSGWDIIYCREELKLAMRQLEGSHEHLLSHFRSSYYYLPDDVCHVCGEWNYWRPFGENMWLVDGNEDAPRDCCDSCKCYVEAAYFYQILAFGIPKWPTRFPPYYYEVFRDSYFGRERVVKRRFPLLDAERE